MWTEKPVLGAGWGSVLVRLTHLHPASLTSAIVEADFFRRRLAPLRGCLCPVWFYTGDDDNHDVAVLTHLVG